MTTFGKPVPSLQVVLTTWLSGLAVLGTCGPSHGHADDRPWDTLRHDRPAVSRAQQVRAECRRQGVSLKVTPPDARDRATGKVATLHARFAFTFLSDEEVKERPWLGRRRKVCLVEGKSAQLLDAETTPITTTIRADSETLQQIVVDGKAVMLRVVPGKTVRILPHPCAEWVVDADWLDDGRKIVPGKAIYHGKGQQCPDGFIDGGDRFYANDPRCGEVSNSNCPWKRCVRPASLRVHSPGVIRPRTRDGTMRHAIAYAHVGSSIRLRGIDDKNQPLGEQPHTTSPYGGCPLFETIETPNERVSIAPGFGEHWLLKIDEDGRLQGRVVAPRTQAGEATSEQTD